MRRERQLEGLEVVGRLLGSSPTQLLTQMAVEAGPSMNSAEAGQLRPTVGGSPHKEFHKGELKRPKRYKMGTVTLCKICQYQKSTELLIHKCPFVHLVCKIAQGYRAHNLCFQVHAVQELQEATKYYLTGLLEDANMCVIHAKCLTIMSIDIQLAHHIHGEQHM